MPRSSPNKPRSKTKAMIVSMLLAALAFLALTLTEALICRKNPIVQAYTPAVSFGVLALSGLFGGIICVAVTRGFWAAILPHAFFLVCFCLALGLCLGGGIGDPGVFLLRMVVLFAGECVGGLLFRLTATTRVRGKRRPKRRSA